MRKQVRRNATTCSTNLPNGHYLATETLTFNQAYNPSPVSQPYIPHPLGTCESWNAERGTWNGSKIRAVRFHHYSLDWTHPKICKMPFQCRTEAKHTYLFTKLACIACFRIFPRVGRGQSSRAYLMSFNERLEEHLFTTDIELQPFAEA